MAFQTDIMRVLKETSRTFAIPVAVLPGKLKETISFAYLCMRAIDEIEDHASLDNQEKTALLRKTSQNLQAYAYSNSKIDKNELNTVFAPYQSMLPEVTLRLEEWLAKTPKEIAPRLVDATASIADRMAFWAEINWLIESESDLNSYTFSVAGAVGLLICDIWAWFDGSQLDRANAVNFGRGLQSVNILRNREEDLQRKVDFLPRGWSTGDMAAYARKHLGSVRSEIKSMPEHSYNHFVKIPLHLAEATIAAIEAGRSKLSREEVLSISGMS